MPFICLLGWCKHIQLSIFLVTLCSVPTCFAHLVKYMNCSIFFLLLLAVYSVLRYMAKQKKRVCLAIAWIIKLIHNKMWSSFSNHKAAWNSTERKTRTTFMRHQMEEMKLKFTSNFVSIYVKKWIQFNSFLGLNGSLS